MTLGSIWADGHNKFTIWTIPNPSQSMDIPLLVLKNLMNKNRERFVFPCFYFAISFDNSILQKQSGFTICKARHEISKTNLSGLFRF